MILFMDTDGGGGGGATAYQYWRIYITDNDGNATYTSMGEVNLLDGASADFISGLLDGDCGESSRDGSDGAHRLTDGDQDSEWVTAGGSALPSWVSFQLLTPKVLVSYRIRSQRVVTGRNPTEWEVQGSNGDPSTGPWTTVHTVTGETGWAVKEQRTYTL